MDAMHARSEVERRVKYIQNKDEVPNGLLYWIVWVTVEHGDQGPYYAGVAGSELRVDRTIKRAYKSMAQHVTHMEKSLKGTDRKSTRLNSSHVAISYAVFCLKKKTIKDTYG